MLGRYRLSSGQLAEDSSNHVEHRYRDDERWKAQVGDEESVDHTDREADSKADPNGCRERHSDIRRGVLADEKGDEARRRAHRQIDLTHDDEHRLGCSKQADHRGLDEDGADALA